jgi:nucleobase:cation symporter-1, NCS1 family
VVFADRWLRRGSSVDAVLEDAEHQGSEEHVGVIAMIVGMAISVWLFANQQFLQGLIASHHPALGDITFEVGFVLSAVLYVLLYKLSRTRSERV